MRLLASATDVAHLLDEYDTFLFDCDGVLWEGAHSLPGAMGTVQALIEAGKRVFFVTNNGSKTRQQYSDRFAQDGLQICPTQIVTSASMCVDYLKEKHPHITKAYVIANVGMYHELKNAGITPIGGIDHKDLHMDMATFPSMEVDRDIGAIVVGFDPWFNYYKIAYSSVVVQQNPDAILLAASLDQCARIGGRFLPATITFVRAIEAGTGKQALVMGKPNPFIVQFLAEKYSLDRSRMIMVGDSLDTDIALARDTGIASILVYTGITSRDQAASQSEYVPTYVMDHIGLIGECMLQSNPEETQLTAELELEVETVTVQA